MSKVNKIVTPHSMEFVVTYPTATRLYGAWSVTYPDGASLSEDQRKRSVYVYALKNDLGNGLFIQAFLKSDISINIPAGVTDIAEVIDGAEKANQMATTFTRDIEGLEVGNSNPGVDVSPGDVVDVMVGPGVFREAKVSGLEFVATPTGMVRKIKISKDILNRNEKLLKHQSDTWLRIVDERKRMGANQTALEAYVLQKYGAKLVGEGEIMADQDNQKIGKFWVGIHTDYIIYDNAITFFANFGENGKNLLGGDGTLVIFASDLNTGVTYWATAEMANTTLAKTPLQTFDPKNKPKLGKMQLFLFFKKKQ